MPQFTYDDIRKKVIKREIYKVYLKDYSSIFDIFKENESDFQESSGYLRFIRLVDFKIQLPATTGAKAPGNMVSSSFISAINGKIPLFVQLDILPYFKLPNPFPLTTTPSLNGCYVACVDKEPFNVFTSPNNDQVLSLNTCSVARSTHDLVPWNNPISFFYGNKETQISFTGSSELNSIFTSLGTENGSVTNTSLGQNGNITSTITLPLITPDINLDIPTNYRKRINGGLALNNKTDSDDFQNTNGNFTYKLPNSSSLPITSYEFFQAPANQISYIKKLFVKPQFGSTSRAINNHALFHWLYTSTKQDSQYLIQIPLWCESINCCLYENVPRVKKESMNSNILTIMNNGTSTHPTSYGTSDFLPKTENANIPLTPRYYCSYNLNDGAIDAATETTMPPNNNSLMSQFYHETCAILKFEVLLVDMKKKTV